MKNRLLIIIGIVVVSSTGFFVLGPSQGHIAQYFLTDKQFEEMFLDESHVNDFRDTQNPSECWYQEDDGSMTPCKMGDEKSIEWTIMMFLILFWPYIILGITLVVIFIVWRNRK